MESVRRNDELSTLAVVKALADEVNTALKKGGGGIRDAVDEDALSAYDDNGSKGRAIFVNGEEVGSLSVSAPKTTIDTEPVITNANALVDWMLYDPDGRVECRSLLLSDLKKTLKWATSEGLMPDGVELRDVKRRGKPRTTLKVSRPAVLRALGIPSDGFVLEAMVDGVLALPEAANETEEEADE